LHGKGEVNLTDTMKGNSLYFCTSARKWGWWRQCCVSLDRREEWVWGFCFFSFPAHFPGFTTSCLWQTNNFSDLRLSRSSSGLLQI